MTQKEMLTALITIKRGIYSKPVKKYIDTLIANLKTVEGHCYKSAMSYQVTQERAFYTPLIDKEI